MKPGIPNYLVIAVLLGLSVLIVLLCAHLFNRNDTEKSQLCSAATILSELNKLGDGDTMSYIITKETRQKGKSEWRWFFQVAIGGHVNEAVTDHGQFMDGQLQKKLESMGIGFEDGMIGGAIAPVTIGSKKTGILLPCKIWSDGTCTTPTPGAVPVLPPALKGRIIA